MKTVKEFREERDEKIYRMSKRYSHKVISSETGLSTSRIKAICAEQREKQLIIEKLVGYIL